MKMKIRRLSLVLLLFFLSACAPSTSVIQTALAETQAGWTPIPTQTAQPTFTAPPTVYVTKIIFVTSTFTAAPLYTPTITNTPAPPTATTDPLKADKSDGFYLVNVDIAPGVWRSTGTGVDCYWSLTTATGDIINNHFGQSGGTAYIPADAFQIEFKNCGIWVYLGPPT
jgi:hypothetical protein